MILKLALLNAAADDDDRYCTTAQILLDQRGDFPNRWSSGTPCSGAWGVVFSYHLSSSRQRSFYSYRSLPFSGALTGGRPFLSIRFEPSQKMFPPVSPPKMIIFFKFRIWFVLFLATLLVLLGEAGWLGKEDASWMNQSINTFYVINKQRMHGHSWGWNQDMPSMKDQTTTQILKPLEGCEKKNTKSWQLLIDPGMVFSVKGFQGRDSLICHNTPVGV